MGFPLAVLGFSTTIAQLLMMRELVATFHGNELLFGIILASWMIWVAIGSWGLPRWINAQHANPGVYAGVVILIGLLLPAQITLVRDSHRLLGLPPGSLVEFSSMVMWVLIALAPLCLAGGFLFYLGARLTVARGGSVGQAYVWESLGAVIGGLLFSFVFIYWLNVYQTAFMVTTATLYSGIWLWISHNHSYTRRSIWISLLVLSLFIYAAKFFGGNLEKITLGWQWRNLIYSVDSPYGRLTIQKLNGQRSFYENGLLSFETQGTFAEEVAHFPLLMHPDPRTVLLIGGGIAGDLREILKHPIESVTYIEIDPVFIEAARKYLPTEEAAILNDPRVKIVLGDGRTFVKSSEQVFDVIITDLPEPSTGSLNRFYTHEFFGEVRKILKPGGIYAMGLPSAENYWSPVLAHRNASLYQTLKAVFPKILVLPGEHDFYLASDRVLSDRFSLLTSRMLDRQVYTQRVTPAYIEYVFTTDRFTKVQAELEQLKDIRLNEDLRPVCYYYDMAIWLSLFYTNLNSIFQSASDIVSNPHWLLWWLLPFICIVILSRFKRGWVAPIVIVAIGLAQMILQVVILFAFQVTHGSLYGEISLMVTACMAGLALGGAQSNLIISRKLTKINLVRITLIVLQISIFFFTLILMLALAEGIAFPPPVFVLLALLAGGLTGMSFPLVAKLSSIHPKWTGGMLYAVDLFGGSFGALLGATLFIPLLGIIDTGLIAALMGLIGVLVLI